MNSLKEQKQTTQSCFSIKQWKTAPSLSQRASVPDANTVNANTLCLSFVRRLEPYQQKNTFHRMLEVLAFSRAFFWCCLSDPCTAASERAEQQAAVQAVRCGGWSRHEEQEISSDPTTGG